VPVTMSELPILKRALEIIKRLVIDGKNQKQE